MIRIPYADIVAKIKAKTNLSESDIQAKVDAKCAQLAGLVSKDGAAHIIANELGVKLVEHGGRQKIKDVFAGMRSVEIVGKITQIYEPKEFARSDGTQSSVGSFVLGDETGTLRVVCWGDQTQQLKELQTGMIVLVSNAMSKDNQRGYKELHLNDQSRLIKNPPGELVGEVKLQERAPRKQIKELSEADLNVELVGTITGSFNPKFFEVCPMCNKSAKNGTCASHGQVTPNYSCVFNVTLDDGSENIRLVFFRNQMERLLNKTTDEVLAYRLAPESFEPVHSDLLGRMIRVVGKANKNMFFDRLEFVAQLVFPANAEEEIARLA